MRYAMIFKLSRNLLRFVRNGYFGAYSIVNATHSWSDENAIFTLHPHRLGCYIGYFHAVYGAVVKDLDRIALDAPVWVSLTPITPTAAGMAKHGPTYIRHVPMRTADYALRRRKTRLLLQHMGCPARANDNLDTVSRHE
jgi:hypothetical protein